MTSKGYQNPSPLTCLMDITSHEGSVKDLTLPFWHAYAQRYLVCRSDPQTTKGVGRDNSQIAGESVTSLLTEGNLLGFSFSKEWRRRRKKKHNYFSISKIGPCASSLSCWDTPLVYYKLFCFLLSVTQQIYPLLLGNSCPFYQYWQEYLTIIDKWRILQATTQPWHSVLYLFWCILDF